MTLADVVTSENEISDTNTRTHETPVFPGARWTTDLVLQMPHLESYRYEIIDGELFVTKAPDIRHQFTSDNIVLIIGGWSLQQGIGRIVSTPGLIYSDEDAIIPDLVWLSNERLKTIINRKGKLADSPEIVIEILSPGKVNEGRDKENKLELFSRYMLQEYWIVDYRAVTIELYRHDGTTLQLVQTLKTGETISSPLLPGFSCVIDRFFEF